MPEIKTRKIADASASHGRDGHKHGRQALIELLEHIATLARVDGEGEMAQAIDSALEACVQIHLDKCRHQSKSDADSLH